MDALRAARQAQSGPRLGVSVYMDERAAEMAMITPKVKRLIASRTAPAAQSAALEHEPGFELAAHDIGGNGLMPAPKRRKDSALGTQACLPGH